MPPIANLKQPDDTLGAVTLSQGGVCRRKYALRFAAGFGSQFTFLLLKKWEDHRSPDADSLATLCQCIQPTRPLSAKEESLKDPDRYSPTQSSCSTEMSPPPSPLLEKSLLIGRPVQPCQPVELDDACSVM